MVADFPYDKGLVAQVDAAFAGLDVADVQAQALDNRQPGVPFTRTVEAADSFFGQVSHPLADEDES